MVLLCWLLTSAQYNSVKAAIHRQDFITLAFSDRNELLYIYLTVRLRNWATEADGKKNLIPPEGRLCSIKITILLNLMTKNVSVASRWWRGLCFVFVYWSKCTPRGLYNVVNLAYPGLLSSSLWPIIKHLDRKRPTDWQLAKLGANNPPHKNTRCYETPIGCG